MICAARLEAFEPSQTQRFAVQKRAASGARFGVLGCGVDVHFERDGAASYLRKRYRDLSCDGTHIHTYAACDESGITHFLHEGGAYRWPHGPLTDRSVAFLADAVATDALLRAIPAQVSMHAAALRYGDAAFAITGLSTAGKTTTAIACAAAGCDLYSDERCIVTSAGVAAYPRTLNIRSGALELLRRDLPSGEVKERLCAHPGSQWRDVAFADLFGVRPAAQPAPLRAIFTIRGYAANAASRRIPPLEMLPDAKTGARSSARVMDRIRALLDVLSDAACFELVLGPPSQTARHIQSVLERLPR